jgi:3-deoxy-7-phosphoheptulonate synthase
MNASTQNGNLRVSREHRSEGTRVRAGPVEIGGPGFVVMAGPCAVEGPEQIEEIAASVRAAGIHVLRGGVFKPRTSPYAFQGMGAAGLHLLAEAAHRHGMPIISEVMDASQLPLMLEFTDILQIGTRNMQNFELLRAVGKVKRPVLLKRGMSATIEEWLLAAEYILDGGNEAVILCERGIRTFETATRNTLDLSAVVVAKLRSHLPVVVDPSHAAGRRELVVPLGLAAAAVGADGLLIDVHPRPEKALCDGAQALLTPMVQDLMKRLPGVLRAVGRDLYGRSPMVDERSPARTLLAVSP